MLPIGMWVPEVAFPGLMAIINLNHYALCSARLIAAMKASFSLAAIVGLVAMLGSFGETSTHLAVVVAQASLLLIGTCLLIATLPSWVSTVRASRRSPRESHEPPDR